MLMCFKGENMNKLRLGSGIVCLLLAGWAWADNGQPPSPPPGGQGGNPPSPPAEAFTACSGKKAGDKITIKMGDHSMQATCEVFPGNGKLAAKPDGAPPSK